MNKFAQFLTFNSLILTTSLLVSNPANAFDFYQESKVGNVYTYTITLDADDSLAPGDQLILTNLSGVTLAEAEDPLATIPPASNPYTLVGFDTTSANFIVNTATSGAATLTGVVSLTSPPPNDLSGLEYQAFFTDNGIPGTPAVSNNGDVTAVPFEPEANLAIFLLLGGFGLRKLKRKFS